VTPSRFEPRTCSIWF